MPRVAFYFFIKMTKQPAPAQTVAWRQRILAWGAAQEGPLCCLDSNGNEQDPYGRYRFVIGIGAQATLRVDRTSNAFKAWRTFVQQHRDQWCLSYLSYELKDEVEDLTSNNAATQTFPVLHSFVPMYTIALSRGGRWELHNNGPLTDAELWHQWANTPLPSPTVPVAPITLQPRITKADYLKAVQAVQDQIREGSVYELNFCQELYAEGVQLDPLATFERLNAIAATPFAAYYRHDQYHALCGSPERFLCQRGQQIIAQPIKGTRRRGQTPEEDAALKAALAASEKDRAENIMIVDLMRNDITKVCQTGTIQVPELFGIYGFERVWQMISTVTGTLRPECTGLDALQAAFPIGSMTGAPKVSSLRWIEALEVVQRGLYAGAIGYIHPDGDLDFNVVIRSLLYDAERAYASCHVGGAIVYDSDPLAEYEECWIKAQTVLEALGRQNPATQAHGR